MIADRTVVCIGADGRPVAETPPDGADPVQSAWALCSGLGPLLGTTIAVRGLAVRGEGAVTVVEVTVGETGPAGEWTVQAAAAEAVPAVAAQRAVIAALLGDADVFTAAMQRFVRAGLLGGAIVAAGGGRPVQVGEVDDPSRLLDLIEVIPPATMVGVRTGRGCYGAVRTEHHACGWRWHEQHGELLRAWFRACVGVDLVGRSGTP